MKKIVKFLIALNALVFGAAFLTDYEFIDLKRFYVDPKEALRIGATDVGRVRSLIEMQNSIHKETIILCFVYLIVLLLLSLCNAICLTRLLRICKMNPAGNQKGVS